jgi:hypothetical protein
LLGVEWREGGREGGREGYEVGAKYVVYCAERRRKRRGEMKQLGGLT